MDMVEKDNLARYITRLLIVLGFSPRHFGFGYTREMILVALDLNNRKLSCVYSQVAVKFRMPVEAVQTAVRTALKTAQEQDSFAKIERLIGAKFIETNYLLAPREFFGIMLEYLTYVWDGKSELF
ncbi:MAG: hypothetical protein FWE84_02345 [Firmicutes bacterium]|nr:hypothetical protein [Bacillota bacterium]